MFAAIGTTEYDNVMADVERDNAHYDYRLGAYIPDTLAYAVRGDLYGVADRLTEEEAHAWVEENKSVLDALAGAVHSRDYWREAYETTSKSYNEAWDDASAAKTAAYAAMRVVAEAGREYAIENELCENYERFLMLKVNREASRIGDERLLSDYGTNIHDEDSKIGSFYRDLMRDMVRFGTRTRKATIIVGRTHNGYAIGHTRVVGSEQEDPYGWRRTETTEVKREDVMTYEECVTANEYAIRGGWRYAAQAMLDHQNGEPEDEEV